VEVRRQGSIERRGMLMGKKKKEPAYLAILENH
jgi:hypothetical protein